MNELNPWRNIEDEWLVAESINATKIYYTFWWVSDCVVAVWLMHDWREGDIVSTTINRSTTVIKHYFGKPLICDALRDLVPFVQF